MIPGNLSGLERNSPKYFERLKDLEAALVGFPGTSLIEIAIEADERVWDVIFRGRTKDYVTSSRTEGIRCRLLSDV